MTVGLFLSGKTILDTLVTTHDFTVLKSPTSTFRGREYGITVPNTSITKGLFLRIKIR